jgi:hypothetical protein
MEQLKSCIDLGPGADTQTTQTSQFRGQTLRQGKIAPAKKLCPLVEALREWVWLGIVC